MSLPYSATVLVNWLPVICMPSPESPAKRMTACSITSRLVLPAGTSMSVDISVLNPRYPIAPQAMGEETCLKLESGSVDHAGSDCRTAKCQLIENNTQVRPKWKAPASQSQCPLYPAT